MKLTDLRRITRPRYDETLYSMIARASSYLGSPTRGQLHRALLGGDVAIFDDLPVNLDGIVASGVFGPADLDGAVHEWTLFPYYAHFLPLVSAHSAMALMAKPGGWPHGVLRTGALPVERLRFCASCRGDMLDQHSDAWWRRSHQLPSSLVCVDHGEPLRASSVTKDRRRRSYLVASDEECPADASRVTDGASGRFMDDLIWLTRAGDALLDQRCDIHPDDRREDYLGRLQRAGMLNRAGEAKLSAIAAAMDSRWGNVLGIWPELVKDGRCQQAWLGTLLMGEHVSPPLHHLLLEGMLDAPPRWL